MPVGAATIETHRAAPHSSAVELLRKQPCTANQIHVLYSDGSEASPLGIAKTLLEGGSYDPMGKLGMIKLGGAVLYRRLLEDLEAKGYQVVFHEHAKVSELFSVLGDPRTAGVLHAGHGIMHPDTVNDPVPRVALGFEGDDGARVGVHEARISQHKALNPDWKPSPALRFFATDACNGGYALGYYRTALGLSESTRLVGAYENHTDRSIRRQLETFVAPILEGLPSLRPGAPDRFERAPRPNPYC